MSDPFDITSWQLPELALELESVATAPPRGVDGHHAVAALDWALEHLRNGVDARSVCEAALWCALRNAHAEGRGPFGLVTHGVLAAHASTAIAALDPDPRTAATAVAQLCAYTAGSYRGGVNDPAEGPSRLAWFEPGSTSTDPVQVFLDAAERGEVDLADHAWVDAASTDPFAAEQALWSAAAGGYHLNEHKLVYPAQLRAWVGDDAAVDPVLFRAAARYAGNHLQAPDAASSRRADAAALAEIVEPAACADHDLERVSVVATGIACTPHQELSPLLLGSLQHGLAPGDLVLAVALVHAARFADTPFDVTDPVAPVGPVHSGTGTNAIRRCLERAATPELRYELALCAPESPTVHHLARVAELTVPPSDDGALDDLRDALRDGDPDMAADCASAVPLGDPDAVAAAWSAVAAAGARDQWMVTHAVKHVVAMHEDFHHSDHPARAWFLAAAARTAAHAAAAEQPLAERADAALS